MLSIFRFDLCAYCSLHLWNYFIYNNNNKWSKSLDIRPHRRHRWMVQ